MSKETIWILSSENDDHWAFRSKDRAIDFAKDEIMRVYSYEISIEDWKNLFSLVEITVYE